MSESPVPFAGIPPEMLHRTDALMADEPDFADTNEPFSHIVPEQDPFTLWQFLAPYKFRMLGALAPRQSVCGTWKPAASCTALKSANHAQL